MAEAKRKRRDTEVRILVAGDGGGWDLVGDEAGAEFASVAKAEAWLSEHAADGRRYMVVRVWGEYRSKVETVTKRTLSRVEAPADEVAAIVPE